jgi:hypothetical protein
MYRNIIIDSIQCEYICICNAMEISLGVPLSFFFLIRANQSPPSTFSVTTHTVITIKHRVQTLIDASKEVGVEVYTEKIKYMLLSRQQNAGQNQDMKIGDRCFENVAQLRYLGKTIINQNLIQEEIKRRLNSGNACYH